MVDIAKLKQLAMKATQGKRRVWREDVYEVQVGRNSIAMYIGDETTDEENAANAELTAALDPETVLRLLAAAESGRPLRIDPENPETRKVSALDALRQMGYAFVAKNLEDKWEAHREHPGDDWQAIFSLARPDEEEQGKREALEEAQAEDPAFAAFCAALVAGKEAP